MSERCPQCGSPVPAHAPRALCPACLLAVPNPSKIPDPEPPAPPANKGGERFPPGSVIAERYRIVAPLGRGGMGEVYRAEDLTLKQPVALKFLPATLASDERLLSFLYNEVRQARRVSDRHVCRIHDVGDAGGHPFLSMELIEGEHLASLLRRIGRLPGDKALALGRQLCAGVEAAHREGLLHLDLKPANLMINQGGDLVITDFGLARLAGEGERDGRRAGTPAYMAPEHLLEGEVSTRCDLFAIGLILHEMLTGTPAHTSRDAKEVAESYRTHASLPRADRSLPDELDRIIARCLEFDPEKRPTGAGEIAAVLESLAPSKPTTTNLGSDPSGKTLAALLFTDIVGSVELQQTLGTETYTRLVAHHDRLFKECLAEVPRASILNETGDGFLVRFTDPADALNTALRLQARLAHEPFEGRPIPVRMGLNMGLVTEMTESIRGERRAVGMPINLAARIMGLSDAGQILFTRPVYDDARQFVLQHPDADGEHPLKLEWISHGPYRFAGHDDSVEIFEVGVRGIAPLTAPPAGQKGGPVPSAGTSPATPASSSEIDPAAIRSSDVYISYAPVDDRPLSPGQEGWISQFHRNLETRIEQLSGEPIKVIQRPPVDEPPSDAHIEAIPEAKAMVSIVSPPFVKSPGCARETEVFWKSARDAGNLRLEDRTRLLKVVKTPVQDADLPDPLGEVFSDLLSFDFFSVDPETGRMWELDETFGVEARRQYYERVYDLSYELCHVLRAFQEGSSASSAERAAGKTIYLAETTRDLGEHRFRIGDQGLEVSFTLSDNDQPATAMILKMGDRKMPCPRVEQKE